MTAKPATAKPVSAKPSAANATAKPATAKPATAKPSAAMATAAKATAAKATAKPATAKPASTRRTTATRSSPGHRLAALQRAAPYRTNLRQNTKLAGLHPVELANGGPSKARRLRYWAEKQARASFVRNG